MNRKLKYWADLSYSDISRLDPASSVAVMPLGATEQHGPHLPLNVDTVLTEGIMAEAAEFLSADDPVYFLPTLPIGLSVEHMAFPGTLTLQSETLMKMWFDIGASVARAGIRKLVLFNSHGGHHAPMEIVARDLRSSHAMLVFSTSWYQLPLEKQMQDLFTEEERRFGIHAGDQETSMMLALRPDLVNLSQATAFQSSAQQRLLEYPLLGQGRSKMAWQMQDYNLQGAVGNAKLATKEKGQALISEAGKQLAQLLQQVSRISLDVLKTR
jgi:creatinine amidohydrolase